MRTIPVRPVHESWHRLRRAHAQGATDANPSLRILSVDGIGAYDHTLRSAMLGGLHTMPEAQSLLPFVRMSYIGIQGRLEEVATALLPGEQLCAFLDDVYLLCEPSRVKELYVLLADALIRVAGIHLHQGKTRAWNGGGIPPENIADLGPEVWQSRGITVLGTPIGSEPHVSEKMDQRIAKGPVGSHPNSSRFTVRMADPPPERKPEGQSHDGHNSTGGLQPTVAAHMTLAHGQPSKCCWTDSQKMMRTRVVSWQRSRCGWKV